MIPISNIKLETLVACVHCGKPTVLTGDVLCSMFRCSDCKSTAVYIK